MEGPQLPRHKCFGLILNLIIPVRVTRAKLICPSSSETQRTTHLNLSICLMINTSIRRKQLIKVNHDRFYCIQAVSHMHPNGTIQLVSCRMCLPRSLVGLSLWVSTDISGIPSHSESILSRKAMYNS